MKKHSVLLLCAAISCNSNLLAQNVTSPQHLHNKAISSLEAAASLSQTEDAVAEANFITVGEYVTFLNAVAFDEDVHKLYCDAMGSQIVWASEEHKYTITAGVSSDDLMLNLTPFDVNDYFNWVANSSPQKSDYFSPLMMFGEDENMPGAGKPDPRMTASRSTAARGAASDEGSSDTARGTSSGLAEEVEDESFLTLDHFRTAIAQNPAATRFVIVEDEENEGMLSIQPRAAGTSKFALSKNNAENTTITNELRELLLARHGGSSEIVDSFLEDTKADAPLSAEALREILSRFDDISILNESSESALSFTHSYNQEAPVFNMGSLASRQESKRRSAFKKVVKGRKSESSLSKTALQPENSELPVAVAIYGSAIPTSPAAVLVTDEAKGQRALMIQEGMNVASVAGRPGRVARAIKAVDEERSGRNTQAAQQKISFEKSDWFAASQEADRREDLATRVREEARLAAEAQAAFERRELELRVKGERAATDGFAAIHKIFTHAEATKTATAWNKAAAAARNIEDYWNRVIAAGGRSSLTSSLEEATIQKNYWAQKTFLADIKEMEAQEHGISWEHQRDHAKTVFAAVKNNLSPFLTNAVRAFMQSPNEMHFTATRKAAQILIVAVRAVAATYHISAYTAADHIKTSFPADLDATADADRQADEHNPAFQFGQPAVDPARVARAARHEARALRATVRTVANGCRTIAAFARAVTTALTHVTDAGSDTTADATAYIDTAARSAQATAEADAAAASAQHHDKAWLATNANTATARLIASCVAANIPFFTGSCDKEAQEKINWALSVTRDAADFARAAAYFRK